MIISFVELSQTEGKPKQKTKAISRFFHYWRGLPHENQFILTRLLEALLGICSMCFAREENAITRKSQNQKHRPSTRRNMQALPPRRVTCCNGGTETDWIKPCRNAGKSRRLKKGTRQPKSRKPLRNRQSQNCLKDRRLPNMENRRGPLNRRIKRYSILQQLNFGDRSHVYTIIFHKYNVYIIIYTYISS